MVEHSLAKTLELYTVQRCAVPLCILPPLLKYTNECWYKVWALCPNNTSTIRFNHLKKNFQRIQSFAFVSHCGGVIHVCCRRGNGTMGSDKAGVDRGGDREFGFRRHPSLHCHDMERMQCGGATWYFFFLMRSRVQRYFVVLHGVGAEHPPGDSVCIHPFPNSSIQRQEQQILFRRSSPS